MHFGKNIKKIRLVKKLSQAAFAELFGIKRSSIGAYEEGRAEPKLEMIIRIANHFSISVDSLVNSELKVNELFGLDIVDAYLTSDQSPSAFNTLDIVSIPFVSTADISLKSIEAAAKESEKRISLPGLNKNHIAIMVDDAAFKYLPAQINKNDLIVVDLEFAAADDEFPVDRLYLVKWGRTLGIGEVKHINDEEYLFVNADSVPVVILKNEMQFILPIEKQINNNPLVCQEETARIRKLEILVDDVYRRIK